MLASGQLTESSGAGHRLDAKQPVNLYCHLVGVVVLCPM